MKKGEKIQSMKTLLEMNEMPGGVELRLKEHGIWVADDAKRFRASRSNIRRTKHPRLHQMVIPKKSKNVRSYKRRVALMHDNYSQVEVASVSMERAEVVRANLDSRFPSFVKPMIRSNVTAGFWLSLPKLFNELHMPERDATITLVDENKKEFPTKYLAERRGLSGGWRGFSLAHNLEEGDVLVFHMVTSCKMQVYIIRSNHLSEVDAALCLLNLDAHDKHTDSGMKKSNVGCLKLSGEICQRSDHQEVAQNNLEKCLDVKIGPAGGYQLEKIGTVIPSGENCRRSSLEEAAQDDLEMRRPYNNIGTVMNYPGNFCEDLRLAFEGLLSETCSIAKLVKASKISAHSNDTATSNECLTSYEQLRSSVSRIHSRMNQLVSIVLCYGGWNSTCHDGEGCISRQGTDMDGLERMMLELKEAIDRLYAEIEVLKTTVVEGQ